MCCYSDRESWNGEAGHHAENDRQKQRQHWMIAKCPSVSDFFKPSGLIRTSVCSIAIVSIDLNGVKRIDDNLFLSAANI